MYVYIKRNLLFRHMNLAIEQYFASTNRNNIDKFI